MTRRALHWNRIKGPKAWAALTLGTAGGAGLAPFAPGTFGTLVGIPLAWATSDWDVEVRVVVWLAIFVIGTWACAEIDRLMKSGDNQNLVIDEVVGVAITGWFAQDWKQWVAAFLIFRLFDIIKLPPVRQVDQWSKHAALRGGKKGYWFDGFGVMADDVVAGLQGLLLFLVLQKSGLI